MPEIDDLITEVEKYPCLWDLCDKNYHNRIYRDLAWEEIFKKIIGNWDGLNNEDKYKIRTNIKKQWNNIRDGFKKYLNRIRNTTTGSGALPKRKYIYADSLQFLIPALQNTRPREGNLPPESQESDEDIGEERNGEELLSDDEDEKIELDKRKSLRKDKSRESRKKNKNSKNEDVPNQILNLIKQKRNIGNDYQDEDSQFLLSFRSDLKGMPRSQKLKFKMSMIQLVQHFTENRESDQNYNYATSSSSRGPTPSPYSHTPTFSNICPKKYVCDTCELSKLA